MKVKPVPIPERSLIRNSISPTDYEDNFAAQVDGPVDLAKLPVLFFKCFPTWFKMLMGLREVIAKPLGLKTSHEMDIGEQIKNFQGEVGDSIAVFKVIGRSETEILTGEDDKHLNFRCSFFAFPNEGGTEIQLATTVRFTGWMGRVYFFPVRPLHRFVMPIILRRMGRKIKKWNLVFDVTAS